MSSPAEIAAVRERIKEMLQRVPKKLSTVGIEATRAYKKAVDTANKQLASSRATFASLRDVETRLRAYQD